MVFINQPANESIRNYLPGSTERENLKKEIDRIARTQIEIPCLIGGKEVRTGRKVRVVMPHDHGHVLAEAHLAGPEELKLAAKAALQAKSEWESLGWKDRAAIFLKAADLLAGPFRDQMNAATMLGQSKNAFQAEIDAACELVDFLRFNAYFYQEILKGQPISPPGVWNRLEYRPLEGFVLAITPFNFTAIAANLPAAPAMLGNTVVWKPSDSQLLSAYYTMELFRQAGLPDGVINFVPAEGPITSEVLLSMKELAGIHFTGSTGTFQSLWRRVGENINQYHSYPRLVGETGGKDFIFAHPSAEVAALKPHWCEGPLNIKGKNARLLRGPIFQKRFGARCRTLLFQKLRI